MVSHCMFQRADHGEELHVDGPKLATPFDLTDILAQQESDMGRARPACQQTTAFDLPNAYETMIAPVTPYSNVSRGTASGEDLVIDGPLTLALLRKELQELTDVATESHTLIVQICDYSEQLLDQPADENEWRSHLRYRIPHPVSSKLKLAHEWVRLFELRPEYLSLAPLAVVQEFHGVQQLGSNSKASITQQSLAAWIKKRIEDDKKFWNAAIIERNFRCEWPLETDIAALEDPRSSGGTAGFMPLHAATMAPPTRGQFAMVAATKKRKRATTVQDNSSDESEPPCPPKRSRRARPTSVKLQATSFSQDSTQQASVPQTYVSQSSVPAVGNPVTQTQLGQSNAPVTGNSRRWPYPMPAGRRQGLRPAGGASTFPYEWSVGRKRAWLEIAPANGGLPAKALEDHWNDFTSCCTSEHADIRRLGDIHVSIVELLSYFPQHIKWRTIGKRLRDAGWHAVRVREFIFWSRQLPVAALTALCRGAMARQSSEVPNWVNKAPDVNVSAGWAMRGISTDRAVAEKSHLSKLTDYHLVDLAEGLHHHPRGLDRGLLTVAVQHAIHNNHHNIKLSDLMAYINDENLEQLSGVARIMGGTVVAADRAAHSRHFPRSRNSPVQTFWKNGGYKHD